MAPNNTFVRARINMALKTEAEAVLSEMGLTVSEFIRMALTKITKDHTLPFDILIADDEIIATIEDSEDGDGNRKFDSEDTLFKDLWR